MSGGPSATTLRYPTLAFAFALVLAGYSVWDLDRLSGRRYGSGAAGSCRITMGVAMAFMLMVAV